MPRPFLTARWSNLCLWTYAVAPDRLRPRLPTGLDLDTRDGQAFVSLVAFDFLDTRVLGVSWPGYRHFAEINLRFYVRHGAERGVVFIRELVPLRFVAWLARTVYHENYVATPLVSRVEHGPDRLTVEHRLRWQGKDYRLRLTGAKPAQVPPESGTEHFFKEHQWGFCRDRRGRTIRYEVRHPVWAVYSVVSYGLDLDWGHVYGPEWADLKGREPYSVVLAAGSAVEVFPKGVPVGPA